MTRGRYEVASAEAHLKPRERPAGGCPRRRVLLLLLLLLLVLTAAAVGSWFYLRPRHTDALYPPDGSKLYLGGPNITEGDMLGLNTSSGEQNAALDLRLQWPYGRVPYRVDDDIGCPDSPRCKVLLSALSEYTGKTCLIWEPASEDQRFPVHIRFRSGSPCYSSVGFRGFVGGPQVIMLSEGCFNKGILLHLLGHTLGLWHEHNRPDRDGWLGVNLTNVRHDQTDSFRTFSLSQHRIVDQLDFSSVMMYGAEAFSAGSAPTMRTHRAGHVLTEVWEKTELSYQDVHRVQAMYLRQCNRRTRERA